MSVKTPLPSDMAGIDTVLLDLDGTLLDLAFDNDIWMRLVPQAYAARLGLTPDAARAELEPRFRAHEGTLEWYSVDFWSAELGVDITGLHERNASGIRWVPGAREFLARLRELGKRVVLLTNAHPVTLAIKDRAVGLAAHFDAMFSSNELGAPKEDPRFWAALPRHEPVDLGRALFVDDSLPVLRAGREAGVAWVVGVRRPDSLRGTLAHEGFDSIDTVADLAR